MTVLYISLLFIIMIIALYFVEGNMDNENGSKLFIVCVIIFFYIVTSISLLKNHTLKDENEKLIRIVKSIPESQEKILTKVYFDDTPVLIHSEIAKIVSANENDKLTIQQQNIIREIYNITIE